MAIGEFGGVPAVTVATGPMYAAPAYWLYEMSQAALNPARAWADAARLFFKNPANPLSYTVYGRTLSAGMELFERSTLSDVSLQLDQSSTFGRLFVQ